MQMCMLTMKHLFYCIAFIFIASVLSEENYESCTKMFNPEFIEEDCCETEFEGFDESDENVESCFQSVDSGDSESKCEIMKCYLKALGIWINDEVNNEAAKKRLENIEMKYPKSKKTAQKISQQCLDDKYMIYGTEDECPALKYVICSYINTIVECDSWKKTDQCSKSSEYASKCKVLLKSD